MPEQAEPQFVGCPYCTRGHRPTWRFDPNIVGGGEWVHVVQTQVDPKTTTVAVTICTAGK